MLFKAWHLAGIADGSITVAFRRWGAPQARPGGTQRTPVGVLEFVDVRVVDEVTEADARLAGYASVQQLLGDLNFCRPGRTYRIELRVAGPDPRATLRDQVPGPDELVPVLARLARLDRASPRGPWTHAVLQAIADRPAVRAPELAASFGRETAPFKIDVRKLKELGLTESLPVGYRLSPRGEAVLRALDGSGSSRP